MLPQLLLFDIDGTLLHVQRGFTRGIIREILRLHRIDPSCLDQINFAGRTDHYIFTRLTGDPEDEESFTSLKNAYLDSMRQKLKPGHIEILPGSREILEYCERRGITVGILSGNFDESARLKLCTAGLDHYFSFGAYGNLHADRAHLPEIALKAALKIYKTTFLSDRCWVIGDTPHDIRCARSAGMKAIALPTGSYSLAELLPHEPDLIFPSLNHMMTHLNELADP